MGINEDIKTIIEYLHDDEAKNFEECYMDDNGKIDYKEEDNHIYLIILRVKNWLELPKQIQLEELKK
jgi:hypothetical protein